MCDVLSPPSSLLLPWPPLPPWGPPAPRHTPLAAMSQHEPPRPRTPVRISPGQVLLEASLSPGGERGACVQERGAPAPLSFSSSVCTVGPIGMLARGGARGRRPLARGSRGLLTWAGPAASLKGSDVAVTVSPSHS